MAIRWISYHVLAVGQGNGTLAVYYNEQKKPVDLVIMDFGSDLTTESTSGPVAIAYTDILLKAMRPAKISAVFFSHSDYDHISLMETLLQGYPKGRTQLPVKVVRYGGAFSMYEKREKNVLLELGRYMPLGAEPRRLEPNFSSFSGTSATPITSVQGFPYYVLIANTASPSRAEAILADEPPPKRQRNSYATNTESLVVIADALGHQFVMAGDATAQTLAKINETVRDSTAAREKLADVIHATVPHHGSLTTTRTRRGLRDNDDWEQTLTSYVDYLKAKSISVTAGIKNKHKHPSAFILQYYWDHVWESAPYSDDEVTPDGRHFTTQFFDPARQVGITDAQAWPPETAGAGWRTVQTDRAVFTNNYWYDGGDNIVPPLPVTPVAFNPATFEPSKLPPEVHWEVEYSVTANEVSVYRHDPTKTLIDVGRALIAGRPMPVDDIPDWDELRRRARANGPAATIPLGDSTPEPRRRPRPRR